MENKKPVVTGGFNAKNYHEFAFVFIISSYISRLVERLEETAGRKVDISIPIEFLVDAVRSEGKYKRFSISETEKGVTYDYVSNDESFEDNNEAVFDEKGEVIGQLPANCSIIMETYGEVPILETYMNMYFRLGKNHDTLLKMWNTIKK